MDRNKYYGGASASLNLTQVLEFARTGLGLRQTALNMQWSLHTTHLPQRVQYAISLMSAALGMKQILFRPFRNSFLSLQPCKRSTVFRGTVPGGCCQKLGTRGASVFVAEPADELA